MQQEQPRPTKKAPPSQPTKQAPQSQSAKQAPQSQSAKQAPQSKPAKQAPTPQPAKQAPQSKPAKQPPPSQPTKQPMEKPNTPAATPASKTLLTHAQTPPTQPPARTTPTNQSKTGTGSIGAAHAAATPPPPTTADHRRPLPARRVAGRLTRTRSPRWTRGAGPATAAAPPPQDELQEKLILALQEAEAHNRNEHAAFFRARLNARRAWLSCRAGEPLSDDAINIALSCLALASPAHLAVAPTTTMAEFRVPAMREGVQLYLNPILLPPPAHERDEVGHWVLFARNTTAAKAELFGAPAEWQSPRKLRGVDRVDEAEPTLNVECGMRLLGRAAELLAQLPPSRETVAQWAHEAYARHTGAQATLCAREQLPLRDAPEPRRLLGREVQSTMAQLPTGWVAVEWVDEDTDQVVMWFGRWSKTTKMFYFRREQRGIEVVAVAADGRELDGQPLRLPTNANEESIYCSISSLGSERRVGPVAAAQDEFLFAALQAADEVADDMPEVTLPAHWEVEAGPMDTGPNFRPPGEELVTSARLSLRDLQNAVPALRPPARAHPSALAEANLTEGTRKKHRSLLNWLIEPTQEEAIRERPLPEAVIELVRIRATTRKWAPPTALREMASIQGALASLPLYADTPCAVRLGASAIWRQAIARAQKDTRASLMRRPPGAMSAKQYAALSAPGAMPPGARLLVVLLWRSSARPTELRQLLWRDVEMQNDNGKHNITLTFRKGKVVGYRGPYSLHCPLSAEEAALMRELMGQPNVNVISSVSESLCMKQMKTMGLGAREARRGSLQAMAEHLNAHQLMAFSGHTRVATLRRYLGWGRVSTAEERQGREAVRPLRDDSDDDGSSVSSSGSSTINQ
jgi:hypothetical protein